MRSMLRGTFVALGGTLLSAGELWAHPGHITLGGVVDSVRHAVSSPYHVSVIAGVAVLVLAWALAVRPGRAVRRARSADEQG